MSESRKKKISFRSFTTPAYYNIRDPANLRFDVEEEHGENSLPFNSRLRIHAKGHPHHKEPRPQYATRDPNMVRLRAEEKRKFEDFLDFIVHYKGYFIKQIKGSLSAKYPGNPLLFVHGTDIANGMFQRYFDQVATKPDEYHVGLFEPVLEFLDTIVGEILVLPPDQRGDDPEVPRHLGTMPGEAWKANQRARGGLSEPLNTRMAARGKTMKRLARKAKLYRLAKANQEITQANADFIARNLGLNLTDPEIIAKMKPTEEEEELLRSIASHEGGRRRKTRRHKT
jgi:hypothetical protein